MALGVSSRIVVAETEAAPTTTGASFTAVTLSLIATVAALGAGGSRVRIKPYGPMLVRAYEAMRSDLPPAKATLALKWEQMQVPLSIAVDNPNQIWVDNLRSDLRGFVRKAVHDYGAEQVERRILQPFA